MLRLAVVVSIVGLMLADPILCRAEVAATPCAETCQTWHRASSSLPRPAAPNHDSTHGCICQGATRSVDGRSPLSIEVQTFEPFSLPESADLSSSQSDACQPVGDACRARPSGRRRPH